MELAKQAKKGGFVAEKKTTRCRAAVKIDRNGHVFEQNGHNHPPYNALE